MFIRSTYCLKRKKSIFLGQEFTRMLYLCKGFFFDSLTVLNLKLINMKLNLKILIVLCQPVPVSHFKLTSLCL